MGSTFKNSGFELGEVPIRVALVGYGAAGKVFHAPLIAGTPGLQLYGLVSSRPEDVLKDWPGVVVWPDLDEALADPAVDLVVVATPNTTHAPIARAALLAGKHVMVDKPCAVTLEQAEGLLSLARQRERVFTVFQNRRWDADFLQLQRVLASGELGTLRYFESHFDRFKPLLPDRWREKTQPGSGLWMDLGPHLLDQCLVLFGCPDEILLDTATLRDGARVDDYFHAQLRYDSTHRGLRVVLHASALVLDAGPRFVLHGTKGSWIKHGLDPQEDRLRAGGRPQWGLDEEFGRDTSGGDLVTMVNGERKRQALPAASGNYLALYHELMQQLQARRVGKVSGQASITPLQIRQVMGLLMLGQSSLHQHAWVSAQDLKA